MVCGDSRKQYGLCETQLFCFIEYAKGKKNIEVRKRKKREGECERKAGTQVYSYIEEKLQEISHVTGLGPVAAKESVSTAGSALLQEGMSTGLEINKDIREQLRC